MQPVDVSNSEATYDLDKEREKKEYGGYEKWEVESWAETLEKAQELMADETKMRIIERCIDKKEKKFKKLKDLKDYVNTMEE